MSQSGIRNLPTAPVEYDPLPFEGEDNHRGLYSQPQDSYSMDNLPTGAARPRFLGQTNDSQSFRDSYGGQSANNSMYHLNPDGGSSRYSSVPGGDQYVGYDAPRSPTAPFLTEKNATYASPRQKKRKLGLILGVIAGILVLIAAAVILIYLFVIKPKDSNKSSDSPSSSGTSTAGSPNPTSTSGVRNVITGGDGSTVTRDDGSTFTYKNSFGGVWYWDQNDPFNNGAMAQSWSPALNATFNYGVDIIRGCALSLNLSSFTRILIR